MQSLIKKKFKLSNYDQTSKIRAVYSVYVTQARLYVNKL
jgi:hypothetical protein